MKNRRALTHHNRYPLCGVVVSYLAIMEETLLWRTGWSPVRLWSEGCNFLFPGSDLYRMHQFQLWKKKKGKKAALHKKWKRNLPWYLQRYILYYCWSLKGFFLFLFLFSFHNEHYYYNWGLLFNLWWYVAYVGYYIISLINLLILGGFTEYPRHDCIIQKISLVA